MSQKPVGEQPPELAVTFTGFRPGVPQLGDAPVDLTKAFETAHHVTRVDFTVTRVAARSAARGERRSDTGRS